MLLSVANPYYSFYYDIAAVSQLCRENSITLVLDLSHSLGSVPIKLLEWDVDAAVLCCFKYLSGGPGSVAGIYIHERHGDL